MRYSHVNDKLNKQTICMLNRKELLVWESRLRNSDRFEDDELHKLVLKRLQTSVIEKHKKSSTILLFSILCIVSLLFGAMFLILMI